ncbi:MULTISPECIES: mannose-6-phosphate isomerase [unclassified Tatumella]|uniref:mannose-6-phosphate isomerase n=1 Tax=unclassified Tatumella TaxID=2649542 RepID=UPI001BAF8781|nr:MULTISPECIES: mannose-6-phosphate isomerase [unclassified Tatumella]MBS0857098.1 mannose-6-phosphate isomerase [Tatumella sp. JGM16]MBS0913791.1 mannose-6-phosphate isomerase [Tatumella sp. JGM91]
MFQLSNTLQHYVWGSPTLLGEMFGLVNPDSQPIAEIWMGAHPKSSSLIINADQQQSKLIDVITASKQDFLGKKIADTFGELPFLFKVLCADKALSIQVHPSKTAAETGFAKEDEAGIPLDSPVRNYKDPNHKPELVFALTPFRAMNAFRELSEIAELLGPVTDAHPSVAEFVANPDTTHLKTVFADLLSLQGQAKDNALSLLKSVVSSKQGVAWRTIEHLLEDYPQDTGLFMPLLLNVIELQPGEAMFLHAETPHAYFKGVGLEVMANSDNVLRAGLTPKHIDVPELLANVIFKPVPYNMLRTAPVTEGNADYFPVPVDDFSFSIHHVTSEPATFNQDGPAIIFCIDGNVTCSNGEQTIALVPGESAFIGANEAAISFFGQGRIARAYAEV